MNRLLSVLLVASLVCLSGCVYAPGRGTDSGATVTPLRSAVIYEVNVRQFTPEGTFDAFRAHLPRLKAMGVDVLWLMPIHPIGEERRKGTLGSYYAVRDYKAVNPEFGTEEDFDELVRDAQALGMRVILDWVANHTAWDHAWTDSAPGLYRRDDDGGFTPPNPDWDDVISLDFDNEATHEAMLDAMDYWVRERGVDGFRCDVAELVPRGFWSEAITTLRERHGELFFLAEGGAEWLYDCGFDATYGWGLGDAMIGVYAGERPPDDVRRYAERDLARYTGERSDRFRMHFTTNHDWNSWNGTAVERLGDAWEVATVLTYTLPGMPLIYSGQEAGLEKQLEFFERDTIAWVDDHPAADLYTRLSAFKHRTPALDHLGDGRTFEVLASKGAPAVFAFRRTKGDSAVVVIANLSGAPASLADVALDRGRAYRGLDGVPAEAPTELGAWGWVVLEESGG